MIDSRAAISPHATIGNNVSIAPFAVIDDKVIVGDNCQIGPHVHLSGFTTIGENTVIHAGANIGDTPQDLSYTGAKSYTEIGKNCIIREYVTVHRSAEEEGHTTVGDNVMLMAFSHLGHDTHVGNRVVIANASLLAGHVEVGPNAFISGGVMIHQFVRIGRLAMVGGGNALGQDVPPFSLIQYQEVHGPNLVGLRRAGWDAKAISAVREAVKIYFTEGLNRINAVAKIKETVELTPEVQEFLDFVMTTKRGIMPGHQLKTIAGHETPAE